MGGWEHGWEGVWVVGACVGGWDCVDYYEVGM